MPKGKAAKIQEAFDIPSYVLHHIMMGQKWPEGMTFLQLAATFLRIMENYKHTVVYFAPFKKLLLK